FVETHPTRVSLRLIADDWLRTAWRNRRMIPEWLLVYPAFGSAIMFGLIVAGLCYRPWSRRRLMMETVLLAIVARHSFSLSGMPFIEIRFVLPLLPFLIVWSANGIDSGSRWAVSTVRRIRRRDVPLTSLIGVGVRCALMVSLVLLGARGAFGSPRFDPRA